MLTAINMLFVTILNQAYDNSFDIILPKPCEQRGHKNITITKNVYAITKPFLYQAKNLTFSKRHLIWDRHSNPKTMFL